MIRIQQTIRIQRFEFPSIIALCFFALRLANVIFYYYTIQNSLALFKQEREENRIIYGTFFLAHGILDKKYFKT